ncbi:hypothetical protein [Streptomyces sp. NPDC059979]|uniref:hypothetical protein n=1 Tax=Streptomyces sp. NPDC059979 TaxID=3347021 RepID=UPI0036978D99
MADSSSAGSRAAVHGLALPAYTNRVPSGAGVAATVPAQTLSAAALAHNARRIFMTSVLS